MKVKSVSESTDRYVKGCVRAFLEGSKNFPWVASIIGTNESGIRRAELALLQLGTCGDPNRRAQLAAYVTECRRGLQSSHV